VQAITRRNALELSDSRWRYDIGRLISTLDELLAPTPVERPSERTVGAEAAAPKDTAQPSGKTLPRAPDAATISVEAKRTARPWGGSRLRWLLLAALAIAAVAAAVLIAVQLIGGIPEGEFRETDLSDLVLDEAPENLRLGKYGAGYPDDLPFAIEEPQGAYYREFTQRNEGDMPYRYSLAGAAVFENEDGAKQALGSITAGLQGSTIKEEEEVPDLGDGGYVFQGTEEPQYIYAWRTGELLQYFYLVWSQGSANKATALGFAEKMEALVPAAPL
jgi:hypothetical protein